MRTGSRRHRISTVFQIPGRRADSLRIGRYTNFLDITGNSALMLVTARLKYIVEHEWGKRRYLDMSKLEEMDELRGKAEG